MLTTIVITLTITYNADNKNYNSNNNTYNGSNKTFDANNNNYKKLILYV